MSIDTAAKRLSVLDMDMPFAPGMPMADGTLADGDLYQFLWLYSGISAEPPPEPGLLPGNRWIGIRNLSTGF